MRKHPLDPLAPCPLGSWASAAILAIALGGTSPVGSAVAQSLPEDPGESNPRDIEDPGPRDTVKTRRRPAYDPVGVRVGSFFLFPALGVTEFYRDNIFYDDEDEKSDFVTVISPSARLRSNWNNHALSVYGGVDVGRYADNGAEDYTDARVGADGRLDIDRDTRLNGGVSLARLHEDRSSPDQAGAAEPVTYRRWQGDAALSRRFNRLNASIAGDLAYYRYDNVDARGGGTFISDDRDRRKSEGTARLGYDLSSRVEPFVRASVNERTYDADRNAAGLSRDSRGWEAVGGAAFDLGGITYGEAYLGYLEQRYDDDAFGTISGLGFGADVTWNPTGLTTVTTGVSRSVEETTVSGASGALESGFRLGIDHEFRRNVILSADGRLATVDYDGIAREDDTAGIGGGVTYLMNEYLDISARYTFDTRDSTVSGAGYDTQTVLFRATGKL